MSASTSELRIPVFVVKSSALWLKIYKKQWVIIDGLDILYEREGRAAGEEYATAVKSGRDDEVTRFV